MGKHMALNFDIPFWPRYPDGKNLRIYYNRTVAPTVEPVTIDEAIRHLQLSIRDDDACVLSAIKTARDYFESYTGRVIMASTWVAVCEEWPTNRKIELTPSPVTAITSVKYFADGANSLTTVSTDDYVFSPYVSPAAITFGNSLASPSLSKRPDAVQITFTAGVASPLNVSPMLIHTVKILTHYFYWNPSPITVAQVHLLPMQLQNLLSSQRVSGWVA